MVINSKKPFYDSVKNELALFQENNKSLFASNEVLKVDLHCHDHNSDVPDEILGRILNVSETWLPTEKLLHTLEKHGMEAYTITNHNNARSCFELLDKGFDILTGAEFSCMVPDYQVGIHVLTYGFSPKQETILNKLRKNIYSFLDYTQANNIPTIWAHPLYHYKKSGSLSLDFFNKMALLFERFEVLNGQRDTWQNMLVKKWIGSLTEEKLADFSKQFGIETDRYCHHPFRKSMTGGSDSHMGFFSGLTGTNLNIENLAERRKTISLAELSLEAIREGRMTPFGGYNNSEKMMITFLDYVCQITINGKDPGLLRVFMHNGELRQKITAMLVTNGFAELRQHKVTMNFINMFHDSMAGIEPHFTKRWLIPKEYKPIFDQLKIISGLYDADHREAVEGYSNSIRKVYDTLGNILSERISEKISEFKGNKKSEKIDLNKLISGLELPLELRTYLGTNKNKGFSAQSASQSPDIEKFLDGLSFPFLTSSVILSAHFTSASVLYKNRPLLNEFSKALGYLEHPKRMLWIAEIWDEKSGIATFLRSILEEIKTRNLPVDIMICSNKVQSEDHLIVIKPQSEIEIPFYKNRKLRVPDFLEIHHKFLDGDYDRIMCSSEGPAGLAALYLKHAYSVPAYFYLQTDWKIFSKKFLKLERENHNKLLRLLRTFYRAFDGVFVLNSDHFKWLTDNKMGLDQSSVFLTAHWPGSHFFPRPSAKKQLFKTQKDQPVILYTGRISLERGVMELPALYKAVNSVIPNTQIVIAGRGPDEEKLKKALPEALFLGWVDPLELSSIYSSADILVIPSKYDTFSCVILESLCCGLPVIAYNTKSPKDIIRNGENGFLVTKPSEMIEQTISYLNNSDLQKNMKKASVDISKDFTSDKIINKLLINTGIADYS